MMRKEDQENIVSTLNKMISGEFPENPHSGVVYYVRGKAYEWNSLTGWWLKDE